MYKKQAEIPKQKQIIHIRLSIQLRSFVVKSYLSDL